MTKDSHCRAASRYSRYMELQSYSLARRMPLNCANRTRRNFRRKYRQRCRESVLALELESRLFESCDLCSNKLVEGPVHFGQESYSQSTSCSTDQPAPPADQRPRE